MSIEEIKQKLGLNDEEIKALLVEMGFKPKAVKVESPEVIAARQELDKFLAAPLTGNYERTDLKTFGDVVAYADHLKAEFRELKPRQVKATKHYEQTDGFKMVLIELSPENAAKAGHPIAVLDIEGSSNWRKVMDANGYELGQIGMVSKGHRDHATKRNGFVGKSNLNKYGLFARLTAEQVEQVETPSESNETKEASSS